MDLLLRLLLTLALLLLSLAAARRAGEGWGHWLGLRPLPAAATAAGAAVGLTFAALGLATERLTGLRLFHLAPPAQAVALPAALLYAAIWWPLWEEALFRGFLQRLGSDRMPGGYANLLQAVLFALMHLKNHLGIAHVLAAFAFGLLMGALRQRTRSLGPGVAAHVLLNAAVLLWYSVAV